MIFRVNLHKTRCQQYFNNVVHNSFPMKMATKQIPLTCPGHTRPVVDLAFSDPTDGGSYYLISGCKGKCIFSSLLGLLYNANGTVSAISQGEKNSSTYDSITPLRFSLLL